MGAVSVSCRAPALLALALAAASLGAGVTAADELPLWELGAGLFPSSYPAYRGSREQKFYPLPFPYIAYRGDILKIDRKGVRAQLFESERVTLNLSVSGAIPAKSSDHGARAGMPRLDIVVANPGPRETLKFRLPVHSVISSNLRHAGFEGWVFNPQLEFDHEGGSAGWSASLSVGPLFATQTYHQYYYEVAPQYATAERPAYRASAGYSGSALIATFSRRFARAWVGGFLRYDYLGGAAFDDSPLVETNHALMGGVAVAWIFARSEKTVNR